MPGGLSVAGRQGFELNAFFSPRDCEAHSSRAGAGVVGESYHKRDTRTHCWFKPVSWLQLRVGLYSCC